MNTLDYKLDKVTDPTELTEAEVIADGQHTLIAMAILEQEPDSTFEYKDEYEEVVSIQGDLDIPRFIQLINSGRSWSNKDFKGKLSTGNEHIDYMEGKIIKDNYVADFIYRIYTIGTANISDSLVKSLKCGRVDKMPKKIKLDDNTQNTGDQLLQAFKDSNMSREAYNNGRLGKGLKQFTKDNVVDIDTLMRVIKDMDKDIWYEKSKPAGSAEASNYADNFKKYYESINN